ncbi:MAG: hypothetical protein ACXVRM_05310 [Solirubrobacteraceae bacterium]
MNDDWRVRINLHEEGVAHDLTEQFDANELEHDLEHSFSERVIVSQDGPVVFCYAGSREQAERVLELANQVAQRHNWTIDTEIAQWHPVSEEWESPDTPRPASPADVEEEREQRVEDEREESDEQGYPEFEVRVQCLSRHDAGQLSRRLDSEGIPHVHRWSYLLVGATDEDSANALAERLRGEVPEGCEVVVEMNRRSVYDHRPFNPFTFLGGLGG